MMKNLMRKQIYMGGGYMLNKDLELYEAIDSIRELRIEKLNEKMKWFIDGVGRPGENFKGFFIRKYGTKNASVEMTKSIALLDDKVMEEIGMTEFGKSIKLVLEFGDGFDMTILGKQVEKKNTASKDKATAAVGNKFSHNKVDEHWITKYDVDDEGISAICDGMIDIGKCKHPDSGWIGSTGDNAGFSKLQVHNSDVECIHLFHGSIEATTKNGKKYVHFITETVK